MARGLRRATSLLRGVVLAAQGGAINVENNGSLTVRRLLTNGAAQLGNGGTLQLTHHHNHVVTPLSRLYLSAGLRLGVSSWQTYMPLAASGVRQISVQSLQPSDK
jgi:hypothetical protein